MFRKHLTSNFWVSTVVEKHLECLRELNEIRSGPIYVFTLKTKVDLRQEKQSRVAFICMINDCVFVYNIKVYDKLDNKQMVEWQSQPLLHFWIHCNIIAVSKTLRCKTFSSQLQFYMIGCQWDLNNSTFICSIFISHDDDNNSVIIITESLASLPQKKKI